MLAFFVATLVATNARGDQVVTGGVNYPDAKIVNLDQGKLQFRAADGRLHSAWIGEVELMIVDRSGVFEDFNQAERFLFENQPQKAIARYERTLRLSQEYWPDVIAARLAAAHDRVGQLDRAVQYWIRLLSGRWSGMAAAAHLMPRNIPAKHDGRVALTVDLLTNEIRKDIDEDRRAMLELLRFEILRRVGDARSNELARGVAELSIAAPARSEGVYAIVLAAMQTAFIRTPSASAGSWPVAGAPGSDQAALDRAMRDCPERSLPGFLILKGRLLLRTAKSREDVIHAAWCFMRVVIHLPDDPLVPEALVAAAGALRRLERADQAASLLNECLAHARIGDETRKQAEAMLAEVRRNPSAKP
ncbi:MAG: hypothetical protein AAB341_03300 [Planctomycetota bacterium]